IVDPVSKDFVGSSLQQELNDVCMSFKLKNGSSQQLFQEKDWKPFVSSLAGSIQESTGELQSYAKNTPEGILLGFMLKKSNTRQDLQDYFRGFKGDDTFVLAPDAEYSAEEISQILAAKTDAADFEELANLLSASAYQELYGSNFPKVTGNKGVDYKGISFQDCMDTTIRMLANIVTYKSSEGKVGVARDGLTVNPAFKEFYGSENGLCAQASEVGNSKVHQAWAQVIENMPGCSYNRIGDGQGNNFSSEIRHFCDGVIPVDVAPEGLSTHELEIGGKKYQLPIQKVGDRTYWLVPKNLGLVCAEMMPNASNVLVTMNHIFGLELFDQKAIFDPKFASTYFGEMSKKLGWDPQVRLDSLDGKASINIPMSTKAGVFTIHLHDKAHGYVSTEDKAKLNIDLEVPETTSQSTVAAIVGAGLKEVADLPEELQAACLYKDVAVLNIDQRMKALGQMLQSKNSFAEIEKSYVRSLITSICFVEDSAYLEAVVETFGRKIERAGLGDFILGSLRVHDVAYKSNIRTSLVEPLIEAKIITVEAGLTLIEKGMSNADYRVRYNVIKAIMSLTNNKLITAEQALPLVEKGMSDADDSVRSKAVAILKSLINYKLITVEQGLTLIEKGMSNADYSVRSNVIKAIRSLIDDKLITVKQALPLVEKGMSDSDYIVRSDAVGVLKSLIDYKLITAEQALSLVEKEMSDADYRVRSRSIEVLKSLIDDKLITAEQALPLLEKGMSNANYSVRSEAVAVLKSLIDDKLITVEQVLSLIEKEMSDADYRVRSNVIKAIKSLIDDKLITAEQALPLVEKGMSDSDYSVRYDAVGVLKSLIDDKLITVEEALPLLEKGMSDLNYSVRFNAMSAISDLVAKKMITKSELEKLKKVATDDSDKQSLEELILRAPISRTVLKVEPVKVEIKTVKPRTMLLENQRKEIIQRMKARNQVQQERQEEELRPEFGVVR
ncbi:MAG: HEAT repeat domain-containing protein, partial [Candidatus Dependentiae bacterium]|nr:HEAT repeat domain-containing protein [Candidatus Dependentiae bacterium]